MNKKILAVFSIVLVFILACGTMPTATSVPASSTPIPTDTPASTPTASIKSTGEPTETKQPVEIYVTAAKALNVRYLPTEHSPSIGNLLAGERINLLAEDHNVPVCENGWLRIDFHGSAGWVNSEYVSGDVCNIMRN